MSSTRIRDWTITIIFGAVSVFLETSILPSLTGAKVELNLIFGIIIWMAFYKNQLDGAILAFILAFAQGALSGTLSGVYMFAGMSLYILCWFLRDRFAPKTLTGQFLFALGLGVFYKLVLLLALRIFVGRYYTGAQSFGFAFLEVLLNAFFAPLIFMVFSRVQGYFDLFPDVVRPRRG